jgi:hypothetical protein
VIGQECGVGDGQKKSAVASGKWACKKEGKGCIFV